MNELKKYRILHTEWSDGWGGQEKRIFSEILGMRERGYYLCLAARSHSKIADKAKTVGIQVIELPFSGKFDIRTIFRLVNFIYQNKINIINTHSGIDSWCGAFAAKIAKIKLIRTRHLDLPLHRRWYNFVHFMADRIVSCGETTRTKLIHQCGFPENDVISIPTGIDFSNFNSQRLRTDIRREFKISETTFVIVMVGVFRAVKRHEVALQAFAKFLQHRSDAVLVLAGEGPMSATIKNTAKNLKINEKIYFLGHREDIPDIFNMADCSLLTSRSEGVPQVITQGLGCAIPTVATNVGGVSELIKHEKTGLLVAAEDIEGITNALLRIASDRKFSTQLGLAGQKYVFENFSLNKMLDNTEILYDDL